MKKLFLSFLAFFIFQSVLIAQEKEPASPLCGGVERWAVKVLIDSAASQVNYTPLLTTLDSLVHIPTTSSSTAPRMAGIEFQTYTIKCRIIIKKNEDDNDYHLVLKDSTETMIGEVPDPVCSAAASSVHVNEYIAARNWVNLNIGVNPNPNINLPSVDVTGVAFVDVFHGQTGAAPNNMEIHPILNIQFSSDVGMEEAKDHTPLFHVNVNPSVFSESTDFQITSQYEMFGKCRLEIYTLTADKVTSLDIPPISKKEIKFTFHRDGLADGMYIYRILNDDEIIYEGKIIIQ